MRRPGPPVSELSHLDEQGRARMVDVSAKEVSARRAVAAGRVDTTAAVVALLRADDLPKGDALAVARLAGISPKRVSTIVWSIAGALAARRQSADESKAPSG